MNDPTTSIMNLIEDNWDDDNTGSITPVFSTGWYDSNAVRPQITFTDSSEAPQSAGIAPFFGIVTNGSPSQYIVESLACNIWVTRDSVSINPKTARYQMKQEVRRILKAKYDTISDLDYVGWQGGNGVVETTMKPVVFRFIGEIGYAYLDT